MPAPATIEIRYSSTPRGQVGDRPRKLPKDSTFRFTTNDPGVLTVEFLDTTPLSNGRKKVDANTDLVAATVGRHKFKCVLVHNGQTITFGDPNDPAASIGGELEVEPT
jgi:hypothetical protein